MSNMFNEKLPWELDDVTTVTVETENNSAEKTEEPDFVTEPMEIEGYSTPEPVVEAVNKATTETEEIIPDVDFGGDTVTVEEVKVEIPAPEEVSSVDNTSTDNAETDEKSSDNVSAEEIQPELSVIKTLTSVPAGDNNFVSALESASIKDLEVALEMLKNAPRASTKVAKIEARIKKLSKEDKSTDTEKAEEKTADAEVTEAEEKEEEIIVPPTIIFEDTFNKIDQEDISEKDKSIMYLMEHYKINPDMINSIIEGDFGKVWGSIKELNNENLAVKQKLTKELGKADDDRIKVVKYLVEKAKDPEFAKQIILEHKDFNRCFKYITDRVRKAFARQGECIQVDDDTVYAWAVEYYLLDDYEQVMKERAEEAERKRKAEEAKKKAEEKRKKAATKKTTAKKTAEKAEEKKADATSTDATTVVKPEDKVEPVENTKAEKVNEPLTIPAVTKEEETEVNKAVENAKAEKKDEGDSESGFSAITDNFGQLTFAF